MGPEEGGSVMSPERDVKARRCLQTVRTWWLCDSHNSAHHLPVAVGHGWSVACVAVAMKMATMPDAPVERQEGVKWPGGMLESVLCLRNSRLWAFHS